MPSVDTGTQSRLRLEASVVATNAAARWSDISWAVYFEERGTANLAFNTSPGVSFDVTITSLGSVSAGMFPYDWRPAGMQSVLVASGTSRVTHNPDGTPPASFTITATTGPTGSGGGGSGATVSYALPLSTLRVVPGTPTACAGARVSDTSINVSWSQTSASNGAPTSNTIRRRINDAPFADVVTISPATATALAAAANQKLVYGVKATNAAGDSAWSADSAPVYTTPGAPTGVVATKVGSDIQVVWTPTVAFNEHQHVVEHGVDVAGVVTWDGSPLATVAAGTSTYTHAAPNPAERHVYRVRARNTDVAALSSATVQSNVVQLLTAPNAPTLAAQPAFVDRAVARDITWTHNSIDTTAQTAYEFSFSTNGGSSWSTTGKVTSVASLYVIAALAYAANVALTIRVRTWGAATSGGAEGTGASPWSSTATFTFKSKPVVTIPTPANSSTYTQAALTVVLGFSQPESATFVSATIGLYSGATLLEEIVSTTLAGTLFAERLADGSSYSVKATVTDSNGITSAQVTSTFSVDYTEPVAASVVVRYLDALGIAELEVTIPAAGGGLVAATAVSIDRVIAGASEPVVVLNPASPALTFLDTTPTINGSNLYRITTRSADGATSVVEATLVTAEQEWAYLSKGAGFEQIVRFELAGVQAAPSVDSTLVKAAGRRRPIALYGAGGDLTVSGTGALAAGYGSTPEEIEQLLLVPGRACYRDPSGRRVFGDLAGTIARENQHVGQLSFAITETD